MPAKKILTFDFLKKYIFSFAKNRGKKGGKYRKSDKKVRKLICLFLPWSVFMVFHGSRFVFHGSMSVSMVFHGSRLVFYGSRWVLMVFYGSRLVFYGSWSAFMVPGCFFMVFHGSRLVFHGFSPEYTRPKLYPGPTIEFRSAAQRAA